MSKPKIIRISFHLPEGMLKEIEELAAAEGLSRLEWIRHELQGSLDFAKAIQKKGGAKK